MIRSHTSIFAASTRIGKSLVAGGPILIGPAVRLVVASLPLVLDNALAEYHGRLAEPCLLGRFLVPDNGSQSSMLSPQPIEFGLRQILPHVQKCCFRVNGSHLIG